MTGAAEDTDSEDELPSGWEERATAQGWVYYTNHNTKTTQWEHPLSGKRKVINSGLPYGWETQLDNDGNIYFVDHIQGRTTYTDPRLAFATEISSTSGKKVTFSSNSSAAEVLYDVDLKSKCALVTGGTSGIGFETAKELAFRGCHVIITGRSDDRGKTAVEKMKSEYKSLQVEFMQVDLASLSSVSSLASRIKIRNLHLNILILNAAVFDQPYSFTDDGIETTFAVNYLSHCYLALLLLPNLAASSLGRILFVSSESHRFHNLSGSPEILDFDSYSNPSYKQYSTVGVYNRTKLLMILFCRAFQNKLSKSPILAVAIHPGNLIYTNLYFGGVSRRFGLISWFMRPFNKTVSQGAATSCYCATALEVCYYPGGYFNGCRPVFPASECEIRENQEYVWKSTLALLKEKVGFEFEDIRSSLRKS